MTERTKIELPGSGEKPINKVDLGGSKEVKKFLKDIIDESKPHTTERQVSGNSLRSVEKDKIENARKEAISTYSQIEIPFNKEITEAPNHEPKKIDEVNTWQSIKDKLGSFKRKFLIGIGALTLASTQARSEGGNTAEKDLLSNKNQIEYSSNGGGERKVKEVPPGYVKSHTDGKKTYYKKVSPSSELKMAKPGSGKESKEYEEWLRKMLASGTASPEQLVKMKYISESALETYRQYYNPPQEDIVYTEPEEAKEEDPFSAYAKDGESLWGPDRHLIGILSVPVRDTRSITESGNINTSNSEHMVLVRLVDKMGNPTGEGVEMKTGDVQKYFGTTMTLQSDELAKELKVMAKKSKTYTTTAEDFAKNQ